MTSAVTITGHKRIDALLSNLDDSLQRKVVISALRKAAKPVLSRMRGLSPQGRKMYRNYLGQLHIPGWLKKSHGIIPAGSKRYPGIWLGPRVGKKYKYDGFYFKFIIEGDLTAEHIRKPKRNWIHQAGKQTEPMASSTMRSEMKRAVERNAKSIANKTGPGVIKIINR